MMLPNGFCDEANQVFRLKMAYATFRMFPADGLRYAAGCEGDALERIVELRFGITFMHPSALMSRICRCFPAWCRFY